MLRFLLRALLFGLGLVILSSGASRISKEYPPTDLLKRNLTRIQGTYEDADSIEILLVGSSHVRYGVEANLLPGRTHVLGLAWNDVFDVEHQVRVLLPRMNRLQTAVISLSYTSFHWDNSIGDDEWYLDSRRMFYAEQFFGPWIQGDFRNFLLSRIYWLARSDHWYNVVNGLRRGIQWGTGETPPQSEEDLERHAEHRADRFIRSANLMLQRRSDLQESTRNSMERTIRMLQDRGVQVILVTPPFHHSYNRRLRETPFPAAMRMTARDLVETYGVTWIDGGESGFSGHAELFRDSDHLNAAGRVAFTTWMLDETDVRFIRARSH